ncbi:MAG: hypothetical protein ACYC6N_15445, partial [Pirellulaceae bacterium]
PPAAVDGSAAAEWIAIAASAALEPASSTGRCPAGGGAATSAADSDRRAAIVTVADGETVVGVSGDGANTDVAARAARTSAMVGGETGLEGPDASAAAGEGVDAAVCTGDNGTPSSVVGGDALSAEFGAASRHNSAYALGTVSAT